MPGLVPGIHDFLLLSKDVDGRDKPGHDKKVKGEYQMRFITLDSETDFDGWRKAARALVLHEVKPADITWTVQGSEGELFAPEAETPPRKPTHTTGTFNVPAKFVELAQSAILHRDLQRFAILYRLLWRLRSHHELMAVATDPDVALVSAMARAVRRDEHKMHAFVRFREVGRVNTHFVAWFEPEHHIVELAAPFFARRFADMPWSILTPDVCAHWDGHAVSFTPGVARSEAPTEDRLEEVWKSKHLQSGAAESSGDAQRDAEEILEEPAGGFVD